MCGWADRSLPEIFSGWTGLYFGLGWSVPVFGKFYHLLFWMTDRLQSIFFFCVGSFCEKNHTLYFFSFASKLNTLYRFIESFCPSFVTSKKRDTIVCSHILPNHNYIKRAIYAPRKRCVYLMLFSNALRWASTDRGSPLGQEDLHMKSRVPSTPCMRCS